MFPKIFYLIAACNNFPFLSVLYKRESFQFRYALYGLTCTVTLDFTYVIVRSFMPEPVVIVYNTMQWHLARSSD